MKKQRKQVYSFILIGCTIILISSIIVYWTRINACRRSIETYLTTTYSEIQFEIESVKYNFKQKYYEAKVYSVSDDITIEVIKFPNGISEHYLALKYEKEIRLLFNEIMKQKGLIEYIDEITSFDIFKEETGTPNYEIMLDYNEKLKPEDMANVTYMICKSMMESQYPLLSGMHAVLVDNEDPYVIGLSNEDLQSLSLEIVKEAIYIQKAE